MQTENRKQGEQGYLVLVYVEVFWWARVDYASRAEKEPGSRLPAAASCLGRHAHPAGRSPNSSSLFLPLAAVIAVAQGLFLRCLLRQRRSCSNPPAFMSLTRKQNKKLQRTKYARAFLVGAGGFEPPKLKAADLQSVPIGHSGTRPYSFLQSCGLPVYVTTECAVCQPIIWAARKKRRNKGREHKSPPVRVRFTASGREGFSA